MTNMRAAGFSLIELMIGLTIAAVLVMLALPSYSVWVADAQIRNAAESIASGLRYAQGQAISQNTRVEFVLNPAAGTGGWTALQIDPTTCATIATLQAGTFREGADRVGFTVVPAGATKVQFTSLGVFAAPCDGTALMNQVQIASALAGSRNLNVLVGGGASGVAGQGSRTGIKICDPQANIKFGPNDPKSCPT